MRALRHRDPAAFRARVEPLLLKKEAENNLILGLLASSAVGSAVLLDVEDDTGAIAGVALQTPPHNFVLTDAPPAALEALVDQLASEGLPIPGVTAPSAAARYFTQAWTKGHALSPRLRHQLRVFECRRLIPPRPPIDGGRARAATAADLPLVLAWIDAFAKETRTAIAPTRDLTEARLRAGDFRLWETEAPVAMAGIPRRTPNGAAIGPVYTPDALRGRGYASAVTAALTEEQLSRGRLCFLFTDAENPTSNKIYRAIGYEWVCDVEEWVFDSALTSDSPHSR